VSWAGIVACNKNAGNSLDWWQKSRKAGAALNEELTTCLI
jgi:hypothetical protein